MCSLKYLVSFNSVSQNRTFSKEYFNRILKYTCLPQNYTKAFNKHRLIFSDTHIYSDTE